MIASTDLFKWADRYAAGILARWLGWRHFRRTFGPPFVEIAPENVRRVLVIRPGGIGDLILLLPAVRRVRDRFPAARITLVAQKRNRAIAAMTNLFDEVLTLDEKPWTFWRRLRSGDFDVVIDTEQFHYASAVFTLLSRAPVRIGFKIKPERNELYTHLVDYPMDRHESEAFDHLVEPLCGPRETTIELAGLLDRAKLPREVPGLPADAERPLVVFPYGGARGKEWPAGRWAEIVRRLLARDAGRVVLVGGADARELAENVLHAVNDRRVVSLVGRLRLDETAAVVARARLYVGCDTGVTHLALALGRRSVVLFGASDERKWGPPPGMGVGVSTRVPCRPCSIFGYVKRCRTIDCMDRIGTDQVWQAIATELAAAS
ncbi:MAG: glycosyltransferase family 9 protein [Deltaproteobacteria bacterium]|nr:glycosyltransferase family 9 protein [Deltaproteobacteria bacterium]